MNIKIKHFKSNYVNIASDGTDFFGNTLDFVFKRGITFLINPFGSKEETELRWHILTVGGRESVISPLLTVHTSNYKLDSHLNKYKTLSSYSSRSLVRP